MAEIEIGQNLLQIAMIFSGIIGGYLTGHKHCLHQVKKKSENLGN